MFEGVIKLKLIKGLRGSHISLVHKVLADDSGTAEGLLCLNNLAPLKVCMQPAKEFILAHCCSRRLPKYAFSQGTTLAQWEGEIISLFLTTGGHAGRWHNL